LRVLMRRPSWLQDGSFITNVGLSSDGRLDAMVRTS